MDKVDFVTKSVSIFRAVGKTFATQYFFTDQLNSKAVNKTTCHLRAN